MITVKIINDIAFLRDKSLSQSSNIDSIKNQQWTKRVYLFGIRIGKQEYKHNYSYDYKENDNNKPGFMK